jgi:hypothetical protein
MPTFNPIQTPYSAVRAAIDRVRPTEPTAAVAGAIERRRSTEASAASRRI